MPKIKTVREHIAWSYANLACAHSAIKKGANKYGQTHYMIRAKLYKGLISGTMSMRSLFDDERVKYDYPRSCCYCGSIDELQMDHLIPKSKGGWNRSDNCVWVCKSCNCSKGNQDLLRWLERKKLRPSILLLRRYIKLINQFCEEHNLMDEKLTEISHVILPFDIHALPYKLKPLEDFVLWAAPKENHDENSISNNSTEPNTNGNG